MASICRPLQCLISALTQAGGGGLLFRLLVPSHCGEGRVLLSPLHCSGSRLLYMERALRWARFQPSGVPQESGLGCACAPCLPRQRGSGNQELDGLTPPGAVRLLPSAVPASLSAHASRVPVPSALRVPSPSPCPRRLGACALCLAATLPEDVDHPESQEVFD